MMAPGRWLVLISAIFLVALIDESAAGRIRSSRFRSFGWRPRRFKPQRYDAGHGSGGGSHRVVTNPPTSTTPKPLSSTSTSFARTSSATSTVATSSTGGMNNNNNADQNAISRTPTSISTSQTVVISPIQTTERVESTTTTRFRTTKRAGVPDPEMQSTSGTGSSSTASSGVRSTETTVTPGSGGTSRTTEGRSTGTTATGSGPTATVSTPRLETSSLVEVIGFRPQQLVHENELVGAAFNQSSESISMPTTPDKGTTGSTTTTTTTTKTTTTTGSEKVTTTQRSTDATSGGGGETESDSDTESARTSTAVPRSSQTTPTSASGAEATTNSTTTTGNTTDVGTGIVTTTGPTTPTIRAIRYRVQHFGENGDAIQVVSQTLTTTASQITKTSMAMNNGRTGSSTSSGTEATGSGTTSQTEMAPEDSQGQGSTTTRRSTVTSTSSTTSSAESSTSETKSPSSVFPSSSAGGSSKCPGFVPIDDYCYAIVSRKLSWFAANDACKSLHRNAHLVVLSSARKQAAVKALMAYMDEEICPTAWTSGQRSNIHNKATPFVWKETIYSWILLLSSRVNSIQQMSEEGCLLVQQAKDGIARWRIKDCASKACGICELKLPG